MAMGGFIPKIQPPHLIRPVLRLRDPIIKCALSKLFEHPLVKTQELSGNLKGRSKRNTLFTALQVSRLGLLFHSYSVPSPSVGLGCWDRFFEPSFLHITQCTALPYNLKVHI